ncbi:hypothetical protein BRC82_09620 [Halobacteriales archaeon QS_1_67_19]|nr:MAG: hypothetical protein BRC82_09620 [Halobacteriales archaeon QS_1_67_19]
MHVANPYGQGLAETASDAFEGETVGMVGYDQQTSDFTSTLDSVFENDPDAVGFVGYPGNGRTILKQWSDGGYGGEWVLSEGLNSEEFLTDLSDITAGMYVASPDPEDTEGSQEFEEKIGEANTLFAAHAYDALFLQALAMEAAGEASGTDDEDINYQGASSPVDLNENLEPLNQFAILEVLDDGSTESLETIPRDFFRGTLGGDGEETTTTTTTEG